MNSRQRVKISLTHKQLDKIPVDIGGFTGTGIHVKNVYNIRQKLGLDSLGTPVKVIEPYQILGEIANDLKEVIGVEVAMLDAKNNFLDFLMRNSRNGERPMVLQY